ncbi:MDR family MFS transporter [Brevibacillus laterosporus]|uniref:MDR family MFS transporter n=1 Tax=Brevibacillus laterosporus TaxID=1465 RepID=UPI000C78CC99|nr:MDR family MFS transporter [Brevibacillus laterosporus]AUM67353.1 MFS transporter [Brevibacillus laterosporus]AYK09239.1 DHA2 family efflux MFS transporter permease subunit [Brevibacillus laterosporus]MCR8993505.1 MFS transporter [Brevibacillus laterosporus]MDF9411523.1 DHA2 family efflux MFS transporter permease subunit [Brevibacillus laterosporus]
MQELDYRRKVTVMLAIMAALLFASINQTIVGTALPKIIAKLGGMDYYSWVFTIYMLTSSIATILVGKLSDMYGRKPFILIGLGVFVVGAFLCGTSRTIFELILYRGIQGAGAGVIMSTAFTSIADLFAPRERGRWQGLMSSVFGLASVFGPVLGGYIVDNADWHWVFWVFLPFGIIAIGMIYWLFPRAVHREKQTVDYWGSLLITTTMVPFLLAFSWAGTKYEWTSLTILGLFAFTLVSFLLFIYVEKQARNPVIPLHLFRNDIFTISNVIGFIVGAGMYASIMYMPFFIQGVLGYSATHSSYLTMPMTLSLVVGSAVCGQLMTKTGTYKKFALGGLVLMLVGMYLLARMDQGTTGSSIVFNLIVFGLGLGVAMPVFTITVQNAVKSKDLGVATASSQLFRSLGGTIGVAIMGTILSVRIGSKMSESTAQLGISHLPNIPPELVQKISALHNPQILLDLQRLDQIEKSLPPVLHELFNHVIANLRDALQYALAGVFLTSTWLLVFALLLTFFLREIPLRSEGDTRQVATKKASWGSKKRLNEQE